MIFIYLGSIFNSYKEISMKKLLFFACITFLSVPIVLNAQTSSEIYVFDFKIWLDQFSLSNPVNVTNNPGFYDNQPSFLPGGRSFLYSSSDESGKTDIYLYDLTGKERRRVTYTPEVSEFSPLITPDKKSYSCIILEEDGTQKLWKYFVDAPVASLVTDIDSVGYHAWYNKNVLALFIVGNNDNALHIIDIETGENKKIASKIGRNLYKIPGEDNISFVDMSVSKEWKIMSGNVQTELVEEIISTIPKSQDYLWTPGGLIIMGDGQKLYKFDPKNDPDWIELADLSDYGLNKFDRIAINEQASKLAVVVQEKIE